MAVRVLDRFGSLAALPVGMADPPGALGWVGGEEASPRGVVVLPLDLTPVAGCAMVGVMNVAIQPTADEVLADARDAACPLALGIINTLVANLFAPEPPAYPGKHPGGEDQDPNTLWLYTGGWRSPPGDGRPGFPVSATRVIVYLDCGDIQVYQFDNHSICTGTLEATGEGAWLAVRGLPEVRR